MVDELDTYIETVMASFDAEPRPWEATKRIIRHRENCLSTYAGQWPAGQWPDPVELGQFLARFLGHILAGHDGSCFLCEEWKAGEGQSSRFWPTITVPAPPDSHCGLEGARLVERIPWEVQLERNYQEFERPGEPTNLARAKSFPRLCIYGRYGVESSAEERTDG